MYTTLQGRHSLKTHPPTKNKQNERPAADSMLMLKLSIFLICWEAYQIKNLKVKKAATDGLR